MTENNNNIKDFESLIKEQRQNPFTEEEIIKTIKLLPDEHTVEYLEFLERNCQDKVTKKVGEAFLRKMGARNEEFIQKYSENLSSLNLEKLERLVFARADHLLDTYLNILMPDEILNEFVILKAQRIDEKFRHKYKNAKALIELAVEINRIENPDELFDRFLEMENRYYEENHPDVDINTFYKLVIPLLRRYSVKKGPEEFYTLRDKVIKELRKHGVNPGHLSIEILERRGRHRRKPSTSSLLQGFELF